MIALWRRCALYTVVGVVLVIILVVSVSKMGSS